MDEFQDTDPLQAELLLCSGRRRPPARLAAGPAGAGKLFIVGDPKQSIYPLSPCRRAGVHEVCRQLVAHAARASFGVYTTPEEIDRLVDGLEDARRVFGL